MLPSDIANLIFWFKAGEIVGLNNNDPVSTWEDLTSNNNDVTASLTERPLYKTGGQNGQPYVLFDGSNDRLVNSSPTGLPSGTAGRTVFIVAINKTAGDYKPMYAQGNSASNETFSLAFHSSDDLLSWGYSNDDVITTTASINTPYIFVHQYTGTNIVVRQNMVELANYADTINTATTKLVLGTYINELYFPNIELYEIFEFSRSLTAQEIADMEAYLDAEYFIVQSASPSATPSSSPSLSPSASQSRSPSASVSPSSSVSLSPSASPSRSPSLSVSLSPSVSQSRSPSVSVSLSPSATPSPSPSATESPSPSSSLSASPSPSPDVNDLAIDLFKIRFPSDYSTKYTDQSSTYQDKYSVKNNRYKQKYSTYVSTEGED